MSQSQPDAAAAEPRKPNPEAIAWYVEEAQRLLEDQQRRAESLRTRGGQIAGFGAAVLALIEVVLGLPRGPCLCTSRDCYAAFGADLNA